MVWYVLPHAGFSGRTVSFAVIVLTLSALLIPAGSTAAVNTIGSKYWTQDRVSASNAIRSYGGSLPPGCFNASGGLNLDLSTGTNGTGKANAVGTNDTQWSLISTLGLLGTGNLPHPPSPVVSVAPLGPWVTTPHVAPNGGPPGRLNWVSYNTLAASNNQAAPPGNYTYQVKFNATYDGTLYVYNFTADNTVTLTFGYFGPQFVPIRSWTSGSDIASYSQWWPGNSTGEPPVGVGPGRYALNATVENNNPPLYNSPTGLAVYAVFCQTPGSSSIQTTIYSSYSSGNLWSDTAVITFTGGVPTGSVKYTLSGPLPPPLFASVNVNPDGSVPISPFFPALVPGAYSFQAEYSGDGHHLPSKSAPEPFNVTQPPPKKPTVVMDASTNLPWSGNEVAGASAFDAATLLGVPGTPPTGTVTYEFYNNLDGTGTPLWTQTVTINPDGSVPNSAPTGPLPPGNYCFVVVYNGDTNYVPFTIPPEPLSVSPGPTTSTTKVLDSNGNDVTNTEIPLGSTVTDQATVSGAVAGFAITGTVTYNFFKNGGCTGASASSNTVPVGSPSGHQGPLAAGDYSFQAIYNGDSNYVGSTSPCEPFSVNQAPTTNSNNVVQRGSTVSDQATVTGTPQPFTITGTVTYNFFTNAVCGGTPFASVTVPVGSPSPSEGPLGPGTYSTQATYGSDSNYQASTSSCQIFIVSGTIGGVAVPIDKLALLAPFIVLASVVASAMALTAVYLKRAKSKLDESD
jgi:hypothetical protein